MVALFSILYTVIAFCKKKNVEFTVVDLHKFSVFSLSDSIQIVDSLASLSLCHLVTRLSFNNTQYIILLQIVKSYERGNGRNINLSRS
jgi:hypothetical protein